MSKASSNAPGLEPIEILIHGRRSKSKPFSPAQTKAALRRLVSKAPEVMVKVSGGGKTSAHVAGHVSYITRHGKLQAITDENEKVSDKDEIRDLMEEWGLDIAKGAGKHKLAFNVVLSMPPGTDASKVLQAAQEFAKHEFFGERKYLMVLHEPDTDPSRKKAEHPHVHLVVQAEGFDGQRLYIRKATLEKWRALFAEKMRDQGIEANATPREIRGQTRKAKKTAIRALEETGRESKVLLSKLEEARKDVDAGTLVHPWDEAIAKRRQTVLAAFQTKAAELRLEGDAELARAIEDFAKSLPEAQTERQRMAQFIRENVAQQRARQAQKDRPEQVRGTPQKSDKERDR